MINPEREQPIPEWIYEGFLSLQAAEGPGRRRGYCTLETPQNISERRRPEMADRLEAQGIRFVIASGLMGQGLSSERGSIEANKPLCAALRDKGIRRVLYVQSIGNISFEPFFAENPEAVDWLQRLASGESPYYYDQYHRPIPCINNEDFVSYVKRVFETVMRELQLDGIFTDNYGYYSYSCCCESYVRRFREYLAAKYPDPTSRWQRFEFTSFDYVMPPPFRRLGSSTRHTAVAERLQVVDPLMQEWITFRCQRIGEVTREFNECIKACNPEAIFFVNYVYGGTPGMNSAVFHGLWPEYVYPHSDLISAEVAGPPRVNEGGVVQGRNLLMKMCKRFNVPLSTCTFHEPMATWKRIYLAEGMAFNTAPVDLAGDIMQDDPPQWIRDYLDFYAEHRALLGHARTVADCAVLHSFESLSYAYQYPHESLQLCEQTLVQAGITFDVIFNQDIDRLDRYRCLVLPNVIALSREAAQRIAEFVCAGGGLVASDDTSVLNEQMIPWKGEWLKPGKSHILAEMLGFEWPQSGVLKCSFGQGRLAIIAAIDRPWERDISRGEADQTEAATPFLEVTHSHGPSMPAIFGIPALPRNASDIIGAVEYAAGGNRTVRTRGGQYVVPEVTENARGRFVHLLNWDEDRPVQDIHVSVAHPAPETVSCVSLISPDRETNAASLEFEVNDGRVEFVVPYLVCHNVMALR